MYELVSILSQYKVEPQIYADDGNCVQKIWKRGIKSFRTVLMTL